MGKSTTAAWGLLLLCAGCARNFRVISVGDDSNGKKGIVLLQDQGSREALRRETGIPYEQLPAQDFEKEVVLAVFLGNRLSGGYSADVLDVTRDDERVVVLIRERRPGLGTGVFPTFTSPYTIVAIRLELLSGAKRLCVVDQENNREMAGFEVP